MTDQEIVNALIERDGQVTQEFFFKKCEPVFSSIIRSVFSYRVESGDPSGFLLPLLLSLFVR